MTGHRRQAPLDQGARSLQFAARASEARLKEREFWPGECVMRDKPVEELLMVRPGETFHQEGVPLAHGLGPLLSTPTPAPLVTVAFGDPVQSVQVVAGNLGPQVGHYQEFGQHRRKGGLACAHPAVAPARLLPGPLASHASSVSPSAMPGALVAAAGAAA